MNVLFLSMWGVEDGLTSSTVFPHLKILADFDEIEHIYFFTVERTSKDVIFSGPPSTKIKFLPFYSNHSALGILNKIMGFTLLPYRLIKFCTKNKVDVILARGAPSGSVAWMVNRATNIPYAVESFEPHADYMLNAGVWKSWGLKYLLQNWWERKQKQTAEYLLPVSINYKNQLISEGISETKIVVIPCCVNLEDFKYNSKKGKQVREELRIRVTDIVGIYVGKFGGIYYEEEAFKIFKNGFDVFGDLFRLIILSPQPKQYIITQLENLGIPTDRVDVRLVKHREIPDYLSASDFAYSLALPLNSSPYLSPIKDGEYWANGLPIMISENIGDDSDVIKSNPTAGVVFSYKKNNIADCYKQVKQLLLQKNREERYCEIKNIAWKYRDFSIAKNAYHKILKTA